jgi:Domain of unknown function (DUF6916)
MIMTTSLTHDQFSKHVNTPFRIHHSVDSIVEAELSEISDLQRSADTERFWMIFRAPKDAFLQQGTYELEHAAMGQFPLFIVPVKEDQQWFYYEAVFNQLNEVPSTDE